MNSPNSPNSPGSPQPMSPRQRLQALLAIPEGQRTDAQWDELNELEIELASGNRQGAPQPGARQNQNAPTGQQGQQRPGGGPNARKFRRFHKRRPNGEGA